MHRAIGLVALLIASPVQAEELCGWFTADLGAQFSFDEERQTATIQRGVLTIECDVLLDTDLDGISGMKCSEPGYRSVTFHNEYGDGPTVFELNTGDVFAWSCHETPMVTLQPAFEGFTLDGELGAEY